MFWNKNKSPQERIRKADKSTQRLRKKRAKLDPEIDSKQFWAINNKIHENNVEIDIARRELRQPVRKRTNITTNINFNKNDNSKSVHFHGHYHGHKK